MENPDTTGEFANGYALVIGVANYLKVNKLPKQVIKDAEDMYSVITSPEYCGYRKNNVIKLIDDEATTEEIRDELEWLTGETKENDTVIIYFSGHGGESEAGDEKGNYLLPVDCDPAKLAKTAISGDELTGYFNKIKAKRLFVVFDCCFAGGTGTPKSLLVLKTFREATYEKFAGSKLAEGAGRVIFASSRPDQVSLILQGMSNSLFTHHLVEGLKGKTQNNGTGVIGVFDLFEYVSEKVPEEATQNPIIKANAENNFPVALWQGGRKSLPSDLPDALIATSSKTYEIWRVEELVDKALTDLELINLCKRYFPEIVGNVGSLGLVKEQRVNFFMDYVSKSNARIRQVLEAIKEKNPDKYAEYPELSID